MEWEILESYRAAKESALRRKYDQSALFLRTALSLVKHRLSTDDSNKDQLVKVRDHSFNKRKFMDFWQKLSTHSYHNTAWRFWITGADEYGYVVAVI